MSDVEDSASALSTDEYDRQWAVLQDFIRYNPGARHRRRLLERLISRADQPTTVLDAGCGLGELVLLLRDLLPSAAITGVDFSELAVQHARERFPFAQFEVLDLEHGRLAQSFDLVVNSEVLEHIADQDAAVVNVAAMVAPGGTLVLSVPAGPMFATERHFGHVRHPDLEWLTAAIEQEGLHVLEVFRWGFPTYLALKYLVNIRPDFTMREFGSGSYGPLKRWVNQALYTVNFLNRRDSAGDARRSYAQCVRVMSPRPRKRERPTHTWGFWRIECCTDVRDSGEFAREYGVQCKPARDGVGRRRLRRRRAWVARLFRRGTARPRPNG